MSTQVNLGTIFAGVDLKLDGLKPGIAGVTAAVATIKKEMGTIETAAGAASTSFKAKTDELGAQADRAAVRVGSGLNRLAAHITASEAKMRAATSTMGQNLKKLADSSDFNSLANKAAAAGVGVAAGLGAAAKGAADFDQSLRNVDSIAHLSEGGFKALHNSVMQLAQDNSIRQGPQDLAKGLYDVYSSGFQGKQALDILKVSAQGASAGMTDTATSSKALMAVLNSGIGGVSSTRQAMDVLFQTVNDGVVTFGELAGSIGQVLPLAASAGVSLQEVSSAIAVMTKGGLSAGQSIEYLNQFIQQAMKPSSDAAKEMDHLGIAYGMTHLKAVGLGGMLQEIIDKTKGHQDSLAKLFPNLQSFIAFLSTSKNAGKDMTAEMASMTHAGDGVGQMMEALTRQNKGAAAQFELLKKDVAVLGVEVGETLLPYVRTLTSAIKTNVEAFNKLPPATRDVAVGVAAVTAALALGVKGLIEMVKFAGEVKTALGVLAVAEGESAAAGVLAFGPAGLLMAALIGLGYELSRLAVYWGEMRQAQDEATAASKRFANAQKDLATNGGERGSLLVDQQRIAKDKSDLDDKIAAQKEIRSRIDQAKKKSDIGLADNLTVEMLNTPDKYGDASKGGLQRMQDQSKKLQSDYDRDKVRLHEISQDGAGAANRALMAAGGDGFARAVVGHAFDNISTPKNVASCALFVSEVFKRAGASLPGGAIASAKGMQDWAIQHGAKAHPAKEALPGDLIVWHDPKKYGARQSNGKRSGYHVGIAVGNGMIRQSTNGKVSKTPERMYDDKNATAYTMPESSFTVPLPSQSAPGSSESAKHSTPKMEKDHAQALVDKAGLDVKKAEAALEYCTSQYDRTKEPHFLVLAQAALVNLRAAKMAEAKTTLNKAIEQAHRDGTKGQAAKASFDTAKFEIDQSYKTQKQALQDRIHGTPAERAQRKRENDQAEAGGTIFHTESAISDYERWLGKGDAKQIPNLRKAYAALRDAQTHLADVEYQGESDGGVLPDAGQEKLRQIGLKRKRDQAKSAADRTFDSSSLELDDKQRAIDAITPEKKRESLELERQMLQIQLRGAETYQEKLDLSDKLLQNEKDLLEQQEKIDQLSLDPKTRDTAGSRHTAGVEIAQAEHDAEADAVRKDEAKALADYEKQLDRSVSEAQRDIWRDDKSKAHEYFDSLRKEAEAEAAAQSLAMQKMGETKEIADQRAAAILGVRNQGIDAEEKTAAKTEWEKRAKPIEDGMKRSVGVMLGHWRDLKGGVSSIMDDIKSDVFAAIAKIAAKWATLKLLGAPKGGGGATDPASMVAALPGWLGGFKKKPPVAPGTPGIAPTAGGGVMDLLSLALPFLGGGSLLGGLLKNPLKGLGKLFHFAKGGVVPGVGFRDTVPAMLTPGETVIPRGMPASASAGGNPVNITHIGDNHGVQDVNAMYDNVGWVLQQRLSVATSS